MKITNKEMTELEKISYDISSYVTHEHNKHDIRSLREFIENRIQESELNKTNDIHSVSKPLPKGVNIVTAKSPQGFEFDQIDYDNWLESDIDDLDDFLEQELC